MNKRHIDIDVMGTRVTVIASVIGEWAARESGPGWAVYRMSLDPMMPWQQIVRGLSRDVAIQICQQMAENYARGHARLEDLQAVLRMHLGSFAL